MSGSFCRLSALDAENPPKFLFGSLCQSCRRNSVLPVKVVLNRCAAVLALILNMLKASVDFRLLAGRLVWVVSSNDLIGFQECVLVAIGHGLSRGLVSAVQSVAVGRDIAVVLRVLQVHKSIRGLNSHKEFRNFALLSVVNLF